MRTKENVPNNCPNTVLSGRQHSPASGPPTTNQDISRNYYFVYNYSHFIGLINVALEPAFAWLIVELLKLNDYTPLDATVSPFLDFDPHTNKIILYAELLS